VRQHGARIAAVAAGLVVALLVVLLATRDPASERATVSALVGERAPAVGGQVILGQPFDLGATDRWVVVNFFATWCVPCVQEHPELRAFSEEHAKTGDARVISVVYSDKVADVKRLFAERGGDWTVFDSDNGRTALDWGVAKIPESYLVSPQGQVVARFVSGVRKVELDRVITEFEAAQAAASPGQGS
jgi:cytochrome c biogenesis protein CcmG/thiol:disulfide interchange protein DsbE